MPAIIPNVSNGLELLKMKQKLQRQYKRNVSFNEVLSHFFFDYKNQLERIDELEQQVEDLGGKVDHKTEIIEQSLLNFSQRGGTPVMVQSNQLMNAPPPIPTRPPQSRLQYSAPNTANLKSDYSNEIKTVFNGECIKPSEVLEITMPKHKSAIIEDNREVAIPQLVPPEDLSFYQVKKET